MVAGLSRSILIASVIALVAGHANAARSGEASIAALSIKPRRKDVLLVDGSIFLRPGDGELLKMEGDLAKAPSFWTRRVRIVRHFQRFAGIRMPVSLDAVANVRWFGQSTFRAVYE